MSDGAFKTADGCRLAYVDEGEGAAVLWQHGLGADRTQPAEVFPQGLPVRRVTLECRGHGRSDLGAEARLTIAQFAEDALALLDHLGIGRAVVGGVSLGAAIALRLAAFHPRRIAGLILARPAWIDEVAPERLAVYGEVAALLAKRGAEAGRRAFDCSASLARIAAVSPDNAASLRGFFDRPRPETTVALLSRIPAQGPGVARDAMARIAAPTLVIGNLDDAVHPLELARALAALIPGARLREIASKSASRRLYVQEFRAAVADFLEAGSADA